MLLALRKIVETELPIPVRIGVHRGSVFAGDIGPLYRRTYTVMGDAVNLSARLMAKAEPGRSMRRPTCSIIRTRCSKPRSSRRFRSRARRNRSGMVGRPGQGFADAAGLAAAIAADRS